MVKIKSSELKNGDIIYDNIRHDVFLVVSDPYTWVPVTGYTQHDIAIYDADGKSVVEIDDEDLEYSYMLIQRV